MLVLVVVSFTFLVQFRPLVAIIRVVYVYFGKMTLLA